jgi:hypothetical protein
VAKPVILLALPAPTCDSGGDDRPFPHLEGLGEGILDFDPVDGSLHS